MITVYHDSDLSEEERRARIYDGHLFVFTPSNAARALCDFTEELIEDAFGGQDPRKAQYDMSVEDFVAIVAPLQPRFIHHPKTKELIVDLLNEVACDPEKTYFDVPRMRVSTSSGYLTSGVGYQLHPHRDNWYSAPPSQLNWWLPIYPIGSDSTVAFHPRYFRQGVKNGSRGFNYYEWNSEGRKNAASQIHEDTRNQPKAEEELELADQDVRLVPKRAGIMLFSGAHLHSTVPNTSGLTRFSIDFRTVNYDDVVAHRGAPNQDWEFTGTTLRDLMRCTDLAHLPEEIIEAYDKGSKPEGGTLIYRPADAPVR
ncbi:MAG: hypothetical protein GEU75_02610 [Dehalococcoidia bacterium]|nr:hypothetical protein [Dehalococcoidia bacterium]